MSIDIHKIRADFPVLNQKVYGKPLIYFDNAATTQKPNVVIEKEKELYHTINSNIHRGVHFLSDQMTTEYEEARKYIRGFINATYCREIVFTKGTTESVNLVAFSFGEQFVKQGDEIVISEMEHHANIVPWQMLCERKKAVLKVIPVDDNGNLKLDEYEKLLNDRTRIVAITHVSNTLGTVNPVKRIIDIAHQKNIPVFVDGAQAIQHIAVDVQDIDADFYAFSGHKVYAPTGIGVLYGKEKWLNEMPPYQGGGDMIKSVSFEKTTYNELPFKFEAGTTNFTGAIVMAEALKYINDIGIDNIAKYEHELVNYCTQKLKSIEGIKIYGEAQCKASVISFLINKIHPYDMGAMLDKLGIAIRTGTHCSEPLMRRFGIPGTMRASLSFYNTKEEIDIFIDGIKRVANMLQ